MADVEVVEQGFLRDDDVADRDVRKIGAIGFAGLRVDAAGIGRAKGRPEHVRADDEQFVGVDRLPGPIRPSHVAERSWFERVRHGDLRKMPTTSPPHCDFAFDCSGTVEPAFS